MVKSRKDSSIKVSELARVGLHLVSIKERGWCDMNTYESLSLMIKFSMFIISLISFIVYLIGDSKKGNK
ncbi:putative holin-like toxin [Schnuerera sp. xch1]|uniref:putative holin-like toxin n=1 Tax=Schnuerera sp. xch1 TaxID=2874283 RepID=UPI003989F519